jgi:hypothetical protein
MEGERSPSKLVRHIKDAVMTDKIQKIVRCFIENSFSITGKTKVFAPTEE